MSKYCEYCGNDHQGECVDISAMKENIDGLHVAIEEIAQDRENIWDMVEEQAAIISSLIAFMESEGIGVEIQSIDDYTPAEGELH